MRRDHESEYQSTTLAEHGITNLSLISAFGEALGDATVFGEPSTTNAKGGFVAVVYVKAIYDRRLSSCALDIERRRVLFSLVMERTAYGECSAPPRLAKRPGATPAGAEDGHRRHYRVRLGSPSPRRATHRPHQQQVARISSPPSRGLLYGLMSRALPGPHLASVGSDAGKTTGWPVDWHTMFTTKQKTHGSNGTSGRQGEGKGSK